MARLDVGVVLAGVLPAILLAVLPIWVWLRRGRDPHYTDDDSVLLPEPPTGFSAAAATIVLDDHASGRTMTAGLMDLASRNLIRFEEEPAPVGRRAGLRLTGQPGERQLPGPDAALYKAVAGVARSMGGYIDSLNMASLSGGFEEFGRMLQQEAATRGWLAGRTDLLIRRWRSLAAVEFLGGLFVAGWLSRMNLAVDTVSELDFGIIGLAWMATGAVTFILSDSCPLARVKARYWPRCCGPTAGRSRRRSPSRPR